MGQCSVTNLVCSPFRYMSLASESSSHSIFFSTPIGHISHYNIDIACFPQGKYGLMSVASVAKDMLCSFTSIGFGSMERELSVRLLLLFTA
jgi:hypothetical protein